MPINHNITNPAAEDWKDKYDSEHENILRTTDSDENTTYETSTYLRVQWIGAFVQAISDQGDEIVGLTFKDNLLGFILSPK